MQSPRRRSLELVSLLFLTSSSPPPSARASFLDVPCTSSGDCETAVGPGYECRMGRCSNNPYDQGCLSEKLPGWTKRRMCNSEDPPDAAQRGICRTSPFQQMEIRISSQNWESAFFESWILQILLSEMLDVPTTIETGQPDDHLNLYDPTSPFDYGAANDWAALKRGNELVNCDLANRSPENYQTCAQVIPEVWLSRVAELSQLLNEGAIEPPLDLGALGLQNWFVPKFTGMRDKTLLSYMGLVGEANRRKLAETFLRPTTWQAYCQQVSNSSCGKDDGVAVRPPHNESEYDRMFVEGLYTGHFRATEANDCDRWPENCTGHFADYPCEWLNYFQQQAHSLNIALESDGPIPGSRGYSYSQLKEMWAAANATRSNLIMSWWSPDPLYQSYLGTTAEFSRVTLPPPTQLCIENRVGPEDRCSNDSHIRWGSPKGSCDETPTLLGKVVIRSLYAAVYDPAIPEGLRSPSYDVLSLFTIDGLQLGEIFDFWRTSGSPREAVCSWVVDHIDFVRESIPRSYPRIMTNRANLPLMYASTIFGGVASFVVAMTGVFVYRQRTRRVMVYAQVEFLYLLLSGLLFISLGAVVAGIPPSFDACIADIWLINFGYTIELVPLIVKVAAINRLFHAAQQMRRVVLRRAYLFSTVAMISTIVVIFLALWTGLDPPYIMAEYTLTDVVSMQNETFVYVEYYCSSDSSVWNYVSVAWNGLMLLTATVLAFQTRKLRQDFNESQTLAIMIYSHSVFVVLRLITFFLNSELSKADLTRYRSLIYSLDTIATIVIYFLPKFFGTDDPTSALEGSYRAVVYRWIAHLSTHSRADLNVNIREFQREITVSRREPGPIAEVDGDFDGDQKTDDGTETTDQPSKRCSLESSQEATKTTERSVKIESLRGMEDALDLLVDTADPAFQATLT